MKMADQNDETVIARTTHQDDEKHLGEQNEKKTLDPQATENDTSDFSKDDKQQVDASEAEKQTPSDSSNDDNLVFWDGDDDPANPYNWPSWLKVLNCVLVSSLTFVTPLGSCKLR